MSEELRVSPIETRGVAGKRRFAMVVDTRRCIGCMACAGACPWGIPQHNPETNKAVKCDYCMDRLDAGLQPACVTKCTTHALKLVAMKEI